MCPNGVSGCAPLWGVECAQEGHVVPLLGMPRLPACTPLWSVLPCLHSFMGCGGRPFAQQLGWGAGSKAEAAKCPACLSLPVLAQPVRSEGAPEVPRTGYLWGEWGKDKGRRRPDVLAETGIRAGGACPPRSVETGIRAGGSCLPGSVEAGIRARGACPPHSVGGARHRGINHLQGGEGQQRTDAPSVVCWPIGGPIDRRSVARERGRTPRCAGRNGDAGRSGDSRRRRVSPALGRRRVSPGLGPRRPGPFYGLTYQQARGASM
jgi:hypothetical protein